MLAARFAILQFVICSILQKFESALRSAEAEAKYRHFTRGDYLERKDCARDDTSLAFADQAVVEAEIRVTEARLSLDQHKAICRFCSQSNSN
jgi:hypothetical protein